MNRRTAMQLAPAAALFGIPAVAQTPPLPGTKLFEDNPERYWLKLREEQFLLPPGRAFLNNGSLGVTPRRVLQAMVDYMEKAAALEMKDNLDYPRWGYETLEEMRAELAAFLGCASEELALTHNATEGISMLAAGVDLKPGDEVVMTDQEHPSGRCPWQMRAARTGITVREVKIPLPPKDAGQLADLLVSAIGPRTRVLFFSGICTTTGLLMPVAEICRAARAKGVLSIVDGAHMNGQIPVNLSQLGCDGFVGSPHKWMFAPAGCGLLYLRGDMADRIWPATVTAAWDDKSLKAARFMRVGTNNRAIFEGMMAGLRFGNDIGWERIYGRIHALAKASYERAVKLPYLEMLSAADDRLYGSLVAFKLRGINQEKFFALCEKKKIWVLRAERMRLATHIHTRPSDLDAFFETLEEARL